MAPGMSLHCKEGSAIALSPQRKQRLHNIPLLALRAPWKPRNVFRPLLALWALLLLITPAVRAEELPAKIAALQPGMTAAEVAKQLNNRKPGRISRQIVYRRHLEQWYYDHDRIRLVFDCWPSKEPKLYSITQPIIPLKP